MITSCNWSDRCFLDLSHGWFASPPTSISTSLPDSNSNSNSIFNSTGSNSGSGAALNETAAGLLAGVAVAADALAEHVGLRVGRSWTGIGLGWLRQALGRREWRVPCLDIVLRL